MSESESAFIYLVRHGEASMPDVDGRWGLQSAPLTSQGITQIQRLGQALVGTGADRIYSSSILRARQSANILGRMLDLVPDEIPELYEIDIGEFEGMTMDLLRSAHAEFLPWIECSFFGRFPSAGFHHSASLQFPGGENVHRMYDRAKPAFLELARGGMGKTTIFVGHAWLIQTLLCHVTDTPVDNYYRYAGRNASQTLVEVDESGRGVLHLLNAGDLLTDIAGGRLSRRGKSLDGRA